jgi:osmotically-inducible protein OsmY
MTRMTKIGQLVGTAAIVATFAACSDRDEARAAAEARETGREASATAREAGREAADTARDAGRAAGNAVENAGRAAEAAVETMDVKAALMKDSRVDAGDINVDTDHMTKTVTLRGTVPTAAQKTIAEQIAQEKAVGYRVQNQLTVGK